MSDLKEVFDLSHQFVQLVGFYSYFFVASVDSFRRFVYIKQL
jgi:hypothetical protein